LFNKKPKQLEEEEEDKEKDDVQDVTVVESVSQA
jgi:hypothetical protein